MADFSIKDSVENSEFKICIQQNNQSLNFMKTEDENELLLKQPLLVENKDKDRIVEEEVTFVKAAIEVFTIGVPITLFYLCVFLMTTISLAFIGNKYDNVYMFDGMGAATLYNTCVIFSFALSIICGAETLGSNAFGIKNYYLLGLYIHRGRLISYLFTVVMIVINLVIGEDIFRMFGLDERTTYYAIRYLKVYMLFLLFEIQFNTNFRYLNILEKSYISLSIMMTTICFHSVWCYLFISVLDYDVVGAAIAQVVTTFLNALLSSLYIHFYNPFPESYFWFNADCFKGWWDYITFTFPTILLICGDWWGLELHSLIALLIPNGEYDYSAHIFLSNISSTFYSVTLGFSIPATILCGKYIAEGSISNTQKVAKYSLILGLSVMFLLMSIFVIFGGNLYSVFTSDPIILSKISSVHVIQSISIIANMAKITLSNICRGLGKQLIASTVTLTNGYIYSLPISWFLAIYMMLGVKGIWIAITSGFLLCIASFGIMLLCFDYQKIKEETSNRLKKDIKEISNPNKKDLINKQ